MKNYIVKWGEYFKPNPAPLAGQAWEHPKQRIKTYGCIKFKKKTLGEAKDFAMTIIRKSQDMHKFLVNPEQFAIIFDYWTEPETMIHVQPNLQFIQRKTSTHNFGVLENGTHFPSFALIEITWYHLYQKENTWKGHESHILNRYKKLQLGAPTFYPGTFKDKHLQKEPILRNF